MTMTWWELYCLLENEEAVTIKVGGEKKTGEAARLERGVRADYVRRSQARNE
jgi:hypothetical protein